MLGPLFRLFHNPRAGHKSRDMRCVKDLADTSFHRVTDSCCCSYQEREGFSAGDSQRDGNQPPEILYYTAQLR